MSNTKDLIGEQATLDGLISRTLRNFEDDEITHIRPFLFDSNSTIESISLPNCREYNNISWSEAQHFYDCKNLHTVYLPSLNRIGARSFENCYSLNNVTFSEEIEIGVYAFKECYSLGNLNGYIFSSISNRSFDYTGIGRLEVKDNKLSTVNTFYKSRISTLDVVKSEAIPTRITINAHAFTHMNSLCHLIIRRDDGVLQVSSTTGFLNETPIKQGVGWIYVQPDMVDLYKADTNWSYFANQIVSINDFCLRLNIAIPITSSTTNHKITVHTKQNIT